MHMTIVCGTELKSDRVIMCGTNFQSDGLL